MVVGAFCSLFVVSFGLLYAAIIAITMVQSAVVAVLTATTWFLSIVLLALLARPHFHRAKMRMRTVPEELQADLQRWFERDGITVRRSWLAGKSPGFRPAEVGGLVPWNRQFVVDEWFFAELTPDEREALVSREVALLRTHYQLLVHTAGPLAVIAASGVVFAGTAPFGTNGAVPGAIALVLVAVASVLLYAIAIGRGIGMVYAADRYAAQRTGQETVIGLLEKADHRGESAWDGWPLSLVTMRPTTERRIARLEELQEG